MGVPFESLGPGQKGRLVYQVIGTNGPIPNPQRIRFMAPGPGEELTRTLIRGGPLAPASAFMGYAQLAGSVASVVNLGVSIAILAEVRKQSQMLRELQADVRDLKIQMDQLLEIAHRTDLGVAENNLRSELRYALERSCQHDEVDLVMLASLAASALQKFQRSLQQPSVLGANREVLLSSDVREMAEAVFHTLWAARRTVLEAHNTGCAGDATLVVRDDAVSTTVRQTAETAALLTATRSRAGETADEVFKHLHRSRKFFGKTFWYHKLINEKLSRDLGSDLGLLRRVPEAQVLLESIGEEPSLQAAREDGLTSFAAALESYLQTWVTHSDAGLLWRLEDEIDMQQDAEYWRPLSPWGPLSDSAEPSETRPHVERGLDIRLSSAAS